MSNKKALITMAKEMVSHLEAMPQDQKVKVNLAVAYKLARQLTVLDEDVEAVIETTPNTEFVPITLDDNGEPVEEKTFENVDKVLVNPSKKSSKNKKK
tara:strand:- start:2816 stop:3109 length:294 start_codon:yes stop_codon:yes gene_type:complete